MEKMLDEINTADSKLIYPEVLETSELVQILKERQIPVVVGGLVDRMNVLSLCYQHLVPQPQRSYRTNRRGQMMTEQQIRQYGHSPSTSAPAKADDFTISPGEKSTVPIADGNLKLSPGCERLKLPGTGDRLKPPPALDARSSGDRLKPPVSVASPENKVIRLNSQGSTTPNAKRSAESAVCEKSPTSKRICLSSPAAQASGDLNKSPKQLLDRQGASVKSSADITKKITRISWP